MPHLLNLLHENHRSSLQNRENKSLVKYPFFLIISIFLLLHGGISKAQDPQFTQTYSSALYANPAFTGSAGQGRVQAAHRIQWPGIPGTFYTTYIGADITNDKLPLDFGLNYLRDQAGEGILTTQVFSLNVGRAMKLFKNVALRIGGSAQLHTRYLDASKLVFSSVDDPYNQYIYGNDPNFTLKSRVGYISFNSGIVLQSNTFLFAYGLHHFNEPNQSFFNNGVSRLPVKQTAQGSLRIFKNEAKRLSKIYLNAAIAKQQDFKYFMAGVSALHGKWKIGVSYRDRDSYMGLLGFVTNAFAVSYSYDYTISRLTNATAGSHEIALAYYFGKMQEKRASIPWMKELF